MRLKNWQKNNTSHDDSRVRRKTKLICINWQAPGSAVWHWENGVLGNNGDGKGRECQTATTFDLLWDKMLFWKIIKEGTLKMWSASFEIWGVRISCEHMVGIANAQPFLYTQLAKGITEEETTRIHTESNPAKKLTKEQHLTRRSSCKAQDQTNLHTLSRRTLV